MNLSGEDVKRVEGISELKVRQYFDEFRKNTLPEILKAHENGCVHGRKFSRVFWFVSGGILLNGGGIAVVLMKVFGS